MNPGVFLSLFGLAACWGPTFLLIKLAVMEAKPIAVTCIRCFVGSIILLTYCLITRRSLAAARPYIKPLLVMAIFGNVLPFSLCAWGETMIQSSTAGIIEATTPLFTALLTSLFATNRKVPREQIYGLILGFIGAIILFLPDIFQLESSKEELLLGKIMLVGMAVSFAISFVYSKERLENSPHIAGVAFQLIFATIILFFASILIETPSALIHFPAESLTPTFILGITGTAIPWCLYFYVLKKASATELSFAIYLLPIFAMVLGVVFLDETIRWNLGIGVLVILFSLFWAGGFIGRKKLPRHDNPMLKS